MEIAEEYKKNLYRAVLCFIVILCLYFAARFLSEFKSYRLMEGSGSSTITFSGHGEIQAVPDIANIYFTIRKESKTVKDAQAKVAEVENKSLGFLKASGVDEKDIKTTSASFNPKYEYKYDKQVLCVSGYNCPPPSGRSVLVGYESSETITVKVRDTDKVGTIIEGLGGFEVTDLNGPNFAIDKEDELKAQAKKEAIKDAKDKANTLARDLGVRLVKITNFTESGNYYPRPEYYGGAMMSSSVAMDKAAPAEIPKGENTISSDVSITYEIR